MKPSKQTYFINVCITALAPMIWGSTYIVTTEMLHENRPFITAMIRTLPLGLFITLLFRQKLVNQLGKHTVLKMCVLAFLNISLFQAMLFVGAYRLPGGIVAIIGSIQPLVILSLMYFVEQKVPKTSTVIAVVFVMIGMGLLLLPLSSNQIQTHQTMKWDAIGILASLVGSIAMALGMYLTKKWKQHDDMSAVAFTGWQLMLGGVMLLPIALYLETFPSQFTLQNVLGYGYLAIFGSAVAYSLWMRGIAKLPTVTVSLLGAFSPITAAILGWFFLNQVFTVWQSMEFVTTMVAVLYVQMQMSNN